jgi:hypothetical protein
MGAPLRVTYLPYTYVQYMTLVSLQRQTHRVGGMRQYTRQLRDTRIYRAK